MKKAPVKKQVTKIVSKPKVSLKQRFTTLVNSVRSRIYNVIKRVKPQSKKAKKPTKEEQKARRDQQSRGILGIGLLFVVVSITYSSYVIFNGVDSNASRIMLIPQVVFALYTLCKAFSKIYK